MLRLRDGLTVKAKYPSPYVAALFPGEALLLQLLHPRRGDRGESLQGGEQRPQGRGEWRLQGEIEGGNN